MSKFAVTAIVLLTFLASPTLTYAMKKELKVGDPAPDFSLVDQNGKTRSLSAYRNHWVVLYFYPKDNTPGCTTEACSFRDDYLELANLNAVVLGISIDNTESHEQFAKKYHLPFPLLADTTGKIAETYGSLFSFGPLKFARRHTFVIDPSGNIARIYRKVSPGKHSDEIIRDVTALQKHWAKKKPVQHAS